MGDLSWACTFETLGLCWAQIVGSRYYWESGFGEGSKHYWDATGIFAGPGSKDYWENATGAFAGPGSKYYWEHGWGAGSKHYWQAGWSWGVPDDDDDDDNSDENRWVLGVGAGLASMNAP